MPLPLSVTSLGELPLQLDPNAKDFEQIRSRAIELIQTITPEWTDFYPNDPGVALLESVSSIAAVLHYVLDRVQNESYLLTAQQRSSVVDLLRLIGYRLRPSGAASAPISVTTTGAVLLPRLWAVATRPAPNQPTYRFELLSDVAIPSAGTWTVDELPDLVVVEGTTISQSAGTSSGLPRQQVLLTRGPLVGASDGSSSISVLVGSELWTEVPNFSESSPSSTVFTWREDSRGGTVVQFGDGINGAIPPTGDEVVIEYRVGGGELANSVGVGEIVVAESTPPGLESVRNTRAPSGGADRESLAEAKVQGPLSLRALDRAVTLEDYATLARQVPGVGSAFAVHGKGPYQVVVYIAAEGVNPVPTGQWFPRLLAGTGLLGVVGRYLLPRRTTPYLDVRSVVPVRPRLRANVQVFPNIVRRDVAATVDRNLRAYYAEARKRPGRLLPLSDIVGVFENSRGVDYVDMETFHRVPTAYRVRGSRPAFDASVVDVSKVYRTAVGGRYTVEWKSGTLFQIREPDGALLTGPSGTSLRYAEGETHRISRFVRTTDAGERARIDLFDLRIDVDAGNRPARGDRWEIGLDAYTGNLVLEPYEVIAPLMLGTPERLDPTLHSITYGGGLG
jgi:hypothetical protein